MNLLMSRGAPICLLGVLGHPHLNVRFLGAVTQHITSIPIMSVNPSHRSVCVRLYKNREPVLDELSIPIAAASSPFGYAPISVVIEEPIASKSVDRTEALLLSLTNEGRFRCSLLGSDRLAALVFLSNVYRSSKVLSHLQIQALGDWIVSHDEDLSKLISSSPNGKCFLSHLLSRVLPDVTTIPVSIPNLPVLSSSGLIHSLISSTTAQLSMVALALTLEASRSPLSILDSASSSSHAEVTRIANTLQWLLDESKLTPRTKLESDVAALLSRGIFSLASLNDSARSAVSTCRTEMKHSLKLPTQSNESEIMTIPRIALIFSTLSSFQDTVARCHSILLPLLTSRTQSNSNRQILAWPEDQTIPVEVVVPIIARPVNEETVSELTNELNFLQNSVCGWTSGLDDDFSLADRLVGVSELMVRCTVLEISMALVLLQDDEVDSYNSAVAKALKKKKNITSKLHYGKPLQRFISGLMSEMKSEELMTPDFKSLLGRCEKGGILSLKTLLTEVITPLNQGSRRPKVAKGALDTDPKRMVIREHIFELIRFVMIGTT